MLEERKVKNKYFLRKDLTIGEKDDIILWCTNRCTQNNEVWLSLVERYVRVTITVLGVDFSESAESP